MARTLHRAVLLTVWSLLWFTPAADSDDSDASTRCANVESPPTCLAYEDFFPFILDDFAPLLRTGISVDNITTVLNQIKKQNPSSWDYYFLEVLIEDDALYFRAGQRPLGQWQMATLQLIEKALSSHAGWFKDVYFILSCLDAPVLERTRLPPLPLIGAVGTRMHWDIMAPGIAFYETTGGISSKHMPNDMQKWHSEEWQGHLQVMHPWENRTQKAFFRGHDWDSSNQFMENSPGYLAGEREACVKVPTGSFGYRRLYAKQSQEGGELHDVADVGLTGAPAHRVQQDSGIQTAQPVSIPDHARYKYLLHLDGSTFSNRLIKLLTLGSVILKQDSPFEEYFYRLLRPHQHFVPIARNRCSSANLTQSVQWLRDHDAEARRIAEAGLALARRLLTLEATACYWQRLLGVYASLQDFHPRAAGIQARHFLPWPLQSDATRAKRGTSRAG